MIRIHNWFSQLDVDTSSIVIASFARIPITVLTCSVDRNAEATFDTATRINIITGKFDSQNEQSYCTIALVFKTNPFRNFLY